MGVLEIRNLSKAFGPVKAIADVSLTIETGTITSIVGANGSGKTTLFNIVGGFLSQDSGTVSYKGHRIDKRRPSQRAAIGIGRLWQDIRVFKNMTVLENLLVACSNHLGEKILNCLLRPRDVLAIDKHNLKIAERTLDFIRLSDKRRALAKDLSYGEQKLLAVGRLLMNDAELLLLDELTAGVNEVVIVEMLNLIKQLMNHGKTILMIEHNIPKAISISKNVYVMSEGRLQPSLDSTDSILREVYLSA